MRTYLFDYGGTLDTAATHWYYVFQSAYQKEGYNIADAPLREAYVFGERALAKERIILPEDNFNTLLKKKITIQVQHLEQVQQLIHFDSDHDRQQAIFSLAAYCNNFAHQHVQTSAKVLKQLNDRGHRLIMVSNFYGNLSSVLKSYNVDSYFDCIIESAVVGVRKPDPAIWQLGVDAANTNAANCIAIGDSFSKDIVPAHSVGCQTIWFRGREWEAKQYDESLPTHIITSLNEVLDL